MVDPHSAQARARIEDPFGLVGSTLDGQYRIDQVVGEGGFGVVYKGWHVSLEQPIAIKALKVIADDREIQDALFAKFKDEAKLLYTLSQESLNIVRCMDFGATTSPNGLWAPYMALEWLAGRSLADDLSDRRARGMRGRTLDEAFALLEPAAEGLTVAHHRRVAHRDIKPANFFLLAGAAGPRVKVLDFGIAKIVRDNELPGTRSPFASFTWLYAAPEQLDPRVGPSGLTTDVYSFALLLTELLTDRIPVEGCDVVTLLRAATDVTMRPTPRQRGASVPDGIEIVCRRALAVEPKVRFANIGELWAALVAARRASLPQAVGPEAPAAGISSVSRPSLLAQTALPPWPQPGAGVFIPSGALLGPPIEPPQRHHRGAPHAPHYPSVLPGSAPMMHPSQLSPPPMTAPPGTRMAPRMPQRPIAPSSDASLPVILAVIGLVLGVMFLAICGALYAACNSL